MSTLDEMGQERQRISERLARLDAERAKLGEQLNELEVAERVLSRFEKPATTERRRRGRPAKAAPSVPAAMPRRARAAVPSSSVSLSEATLKCIEAHPDGIVAKDVLGYLRSQFGLEVRPNHLGIALQRHRRAGRLEQRDMRWYMPQHASAAPADSATA